MIQLAHKICLDPTPAQIDYFVRACGIMRFVWNWALEEWQRQYEAGENPTWVKLSKQFNTIKHKEFPYVCEVSSQSVNHVFLDLNKAFNAFFKRTAKYPKFKSKKRSKPSFYLSNNSVKVIGKQVRIPKLGWVKMRQAIRFDGRILGARVVQESNGKWFVSFQLELAESPYQPCESQATVGVDLGINKLATLSDGTTYENPKMLRKYEKRIKRLQRQLSRKQKGSSNRAKTKGKLGKLHYKVKCIRNDYLHKLTTKLTQQYKVITIEDLNVAGMMKNHNLAKSIGDAAFSEIRRQLEYKSQLRNNTLVIADRWLPSSKTCSACGCIAEDLQLSDRVYKCKECGLEMDRDLNAAINLDRYGRARHAQTNTPVESGSVDDRAAAPKKHPLVSLKQEPV